MQPMKREPKTPKQPALIKRFVAPNLINLINYKYSHLTTRTEKALALSKESGVGKNTIIRAMDAEDSTSVSIDIIEKLADGLDVMPYQLLIPYLDAKNPQVAHNPTESEKRLYERFKGVKSD